MVWLGSRRALLVLAVLFPQPLAQLRVRLLHRGLAQLARDDVIVATVRDIGRHGVRPGAAGGSTAHPATAALLARLLSGRLAAAARRTGVARLVTSLSNVAGAFLRRAVFGPGLGLAAGTSAARRRAAAGRALLRDRFLLLAHPLVEYREGLVEPSIDLGAAIFGCRRAAARAAAGRASALRISAGTAARLAAHLAARLAARCRGRSPATARTLRAGRRPRGSRRPRSSRGAGRSARAGRLGRRRRAGLTAACTTASALGTAFSLLAAFGPLACRLGTLATRSSCGTWL